MGGGSSHYMFLVLAARDLLSFETGTNLSFGVDKSFKATGNRSTITSFFVIYGRFVTEI